VPSSSIVWAVEGIDPPHPCNQPEIALAAYNNSRLERRSRGREEVARFFRWNPLTSCTRQIEDFQRAHGRCLSGTERREMMSKKSKRIAMILVVVVMAFLAVAQHFGWIAGPPPLLAPGVQ
jgi:hypothetical protein